MESLVQLNPEIVDIVDRLPVTNKDVTLLYLISIYFKLENIVFDELSEKDIVLLQTKGVISRERVLGNGIIINKNLFITNITPKEVSDSKIDELRRIFARTKPGAMGASFTVRNKILRFITNYPYTIDDIIRVSKKYVDSFNGDYTYMKQLDYFIFKRDNKKNEETSQLLAWLEEDEMSNGEDITKDEYGKKLL